MLTEQSNELRRTSPLAREHSELQKKETVKRLIGLAEAVGETLTRNRIDIYLQALADLDPVRVHVALESALLTCKWFPKIPEIRDKVLGPASDKKLLGEAEAEAAWERVLDFVDRWHPDIGPFRDAPSLSDLEQRALNTIGGPAQVQGQFNGGKGMSFLHRDFIAAFQRLRVTETAGFQMLGNGEARAILGKICLGLPAADGKPRASRMQSIAQIMHGDEGSR